MTPSISKWTRCAAAALFLFASGFFGWSSDDAPSEDLRSLLLVPEMESIDWELLRLSLERRADARFTLALAPNQVPEEQLPWLLERVEEGRLEIALRIPGDPILPIVFRENPNEAARRLALEKVRYKKAFGKAPAGFVPGGGAVSIDTAKHLARLGFKWAAVGDYEFVRPWYGHDELQIIPFRIVRSSDPASFTLASEVRAVVLDETSTTAPPGAILDMLELLYRKTGEEGWAPVTPAMAGSTPYAVGPSRWPSWTNDLSFWEGSEAQRAAWTYVNAASKILKAFQNSGRASIRTLKRATASLYEAQASRNFRLDSLADPKREKKFRKTLIKVYTTIKEPVPDALKQPIQVDTESLIGDPLLEDPLNPAEPQEEDPREALRARVGRSESSIWLENPEKSIANLPRRLPQLPEGTTAQHVWTPKKVSVEWDAKKVAFRIFLKTLVPDEKAIFGFGHVMVDVYMDLNHLPRRGSTALLPRRRGFVQSADGWEYALVVNGWNAGLYRSTNDSPVLIEKLRPEVDSALGELVVEVPRQRLRGNPAAWGYVLITSAVDEANARGPLPRPLPGPRQTAVLGMIGDIDEQKSLRKERGTPRFTALRLEKPRH